MNKIISSCPFVSGCVHSREMYDLDYRMIEGPPLQYYYHHQYFPLELPNYYNFNYNNTMEEELINPGSPNSTQSDSDNSLSSIEVSPKPIRARSVIQHTPQKPNEFRCCWKNCGIFFDSLDQLASHITRIHATSGPGGLFYCGWDGCSRNNKGFNARYKMLVHVRTHTNEKPHRCYLCDKSFSRAENLKIHSRSHSGEKPYICPVPGCNKAYSNSSDRFKHTRTHQVEKPYQCKVPGCIKRYTDPSSLRKHVKTYKHFINDSQQINDNEKEKLLINESAHSCDCTHMCCAKQNSIIFNKQIEQPPIFIPYTYEDMDIEMPLDLSINSKMV